MLPCKDYSKSRKLLETFRLIKCKIATTPQEIADIFEILPDNIPNYVKELNEEWETDIIYDKSDKIYKINDEDDVNGDGILEANKYVQPITADDVNLILVSLIQSQTFMETKMAIIKNSLLGLLPKNEARKLKDMLYFEKNPNSDHQYIEFNVKNLRSAIAEEKKVSFSYISAVGNHKNHIIIPYSFACELGKYYIIGYEESKDCLIHFRIDRISNVIILEEDGRRDSKFNVYDYLKRTWYMYGGDETRVKVKFDKCCYKIVTEKSLLEGSLIEENEDYFVYEFVCNGTYGIKLWIMGFGADAEVIEPVEFREEIIDSIRKMNKVYSI
ncbi:helix-turn-helix transcriptional regulator [Clostridium estertheticum]|uniref:helix-turn-helix transcriptional regulator n=1 Tax=Clostridium estertheticum TaxID=238834 RepID=UPI001C7E0190|nr:WYL domain-containing protein [Clostridium estertheticum]MBX4263028.1 WYL domain-containing protein [Clostridium estertheticum]WLC89349.1 WYL domain-containing protein [Clostridium estertheticum]